MSLALAQQKILDNSCPEPNTGCWIWEMSTQRGGYGQMWWKGKYTTAHRFAYEAFRGPIPKGLHIDHLCRTRCCVNPWHMEAVTNKTNILRGTCPSARNAKKTHCLRGHRLEGDNLYVDPKGYRRCRECARQRNAKHKAYPASSSHHTESAKMSAPSSSAAKTSAVR